MNFEYQKEYWLQFARNADKDVVAKDLNGSWCSAKSAYTDVTEIPQEHLSIIEANTDMMTALDFGVGMGRNFGYLQKLFKVIYGFDTEPMIKLLRTHNPRLVTVHDDFTTIESQTFDLVYEATVFQHMPPMEVADYLQRLSKRASYLWSWTRSYNDYKRDFSNKRGGLNIFHLVSSFGVLKPVACSIDLALAGRLMDETHYSILWKFV